MSEKLKPCPMCGGAAVLKNAEMPGCTYVACSRCGLTGPDVVQSRAIAAWNTRSIEQELLEAVKLVHGSFGGGLVITFSDDDVKWFTDLVAKAEGKSPNNQTDGVA